MPQGGSISNKSNEEHHCEGCGTTTGVSKTNFGNYFCKYCLNSRNNIQHKPPAGVG